MVKSAFFVVAAVLTVFSQVVITEINRDPAGNATAIPGDASHEYVEIVNFGVDTFTIDSLFLTDGADLDSVVPWPSPIELHPGVITGSRFLPPGHGALILDRTYDSALVIAPLSKYPIKPNTVLFTTNDNELGNSLAGDDGIMLYKGTRSNVSRVVWCATDTPGYASGPAPAAKLVLSAAAPEGIPVAIQSFLFGRLSYAAGDPVTPGFFELTKNNWFLETRYALPDTVRRTFACSLTCIKAGAIPATTVTWSVYRESVSGRTRTASGVCGVTGNRASAVMTLPLDSVSFFLHLAEADSETIWPLSLSALFKPRSPIKITEMFPRATAGEPEWFELYNASSMPIALAGWSAGNNESRDPLTTSNVTLAPGDFLIVTHNSALFKERYPLPLKTITPPHWHTLDNYNDTLLLWDENGTLRETVCYRNDWYAAWGYQSLERTALPNTGTDAAAWLPAAIASPGQPNRAFLVPGAAGPSLSIGPTPFTPNADGRDDLLVITATAVAAASATVAIYDFSGRRTREFKGPFPQKIIWDGKQGDGSHAPVGPFFVVLEQRSDKGTALIRKKGVLWR